MTTYLSGDSHFCHKNILNHVPARPWETIEEMNAELIRLHNSVVKPDDTYIHVGDFAFCTTAVATDILSKLHGHKIIIPGNHDKVSSLAKMGWDFVMPPLVEQKIQMDTGEYQTFVICHYPMMTWNKAHHGRLHLHGHSHGNIEQSSTRFDVGVDGVPTWIAGWPYGVPISADEIVDFALDNGCEYEAIDHH